MNAHQQSLHPVDRLFARIHARRTADPAHSYTASLFVAGIDRIAQKVGEEAVETVIASKNKEVLRLVEEAADLCYHLFVLLDARDITLQQIYDELSTRAEEKK